jgi:hypothetical protein
LLLLACLTFLLELSFSSWGATSSEYIILTEWKKGEWIERERERDRERGKRTWQTNLWHSDQEEGSGRSLPLNCCPESASVLLPPRGSRE